MKIQSSKVDSFVQTIDKEKEIKGVVIYGPDSGLVAVRFKEIAGKISPDLKDPFNVVFISEERLKNNPTAIFDEFLAMSMLGGRRLIIIKNAGNTLTKTLKDIFKEDPKTENFILITAGNLDTKSSLRKFAETSKHIASIPCYKDDKNKISQIVNQKLREYGFIYNNDVVNALVSNFGGNRLIILNEIEKLALYKDNDKKLTVDDLNDCIKDVSESNVDELINGFANLDKNLIYKLLQKISSEGINFILIIRSLLNYYLKLQLIKYQIENGTDFNEITRTHRIFWKQIPLLKRHLSIWSSKMIDHFLEKLIELEIKCKTSGSHPNVLLERFLIGSCLRYKN